MQLKICSSIWSTGKSMIQSEATYFNHSPWLCSLTSHSHWAAPQDPRLSPCISVASLPQESVEGGRKEGWPPKKAYRLRMNFPLGTQFIKLAGRIIRISPQNSKFTEELITWRLYSKRRSRDPEDFPLLTAALTRHPLEKSVGLILRWQEYSQFPESACVLLLFS